MGRESNYIGRGDGESYLETVVEKRLVFSRGFLERRDLEQYFWTEKTVAGILDGLRFSFGPEASCCLCAPTLADTWWAEEGVAVNLLDLDTRFDYLPKFRYFDLRSPESTLGTGSRTLASYRFRSTVLLHFDGSALQGCDVCL